MTFEPADAAARARARADHATSLVVEAGAGTGKTTLLVDRIEALLRSGAATIHRIAAVTFTENAATTMKLRLRERLEWARRSPDVPEGERARCAAALDSLERAPISTIHALAAALLQERPLDCGVVPGFRVADEAEADMLFAAAWDEWLAERLVTGDPAVLEAMDRGIPLEAEGLFGDRTSLRGLARALVDQRDLQPLVETAPADVEAWRQELLARGARAADLAASVKEGDTLGARLDALAAYADGARALDGLALERHLSRLPAIPRHFGFKPRWPSEAALDEGRKIAEWTKEAGARWNAGLSAALHGRLVTALLGVAALYERRKTAAGVLDFLDLLVRARDALRDRPAVRNYFQERFAFLIIDEFQDTDPLQVEVARLLEGGGPGRLVVVGDAKQSIYRFRRAEVALYRRLSDEARSAPGKAVLHLTQNFRSRPAILRFVNRVFATLIRASDEAGQPAYEAIDPPPGLPEEPSVVALRFAAPSFADGADLLFAEAAAVAGVAARAAAGGFDVRDPATGATRPSRAGDVMVLVRRLTQIRHLEEALGAAGIRFTVEGGKSFFDRQEVHEVLAVLRAADDPSDRVSLVAALRSSLLGVSDRDITLYALAGGSLWLGTVDDAKPGAEALGPALDLLGRLHDARTRVSVPQLLERLYDETRILAAVAGTRRGAAQAANLEKIVALARQAADLGALTLRGFTTLLGERIQAAREEPDLPTTRPGDPRTLRILSIHKAKGLEAPIVVLHDTDDDPRPRYDAIPAWEDGTIAVGFRAGCQPPRWDELVKREESKAWAEMRRLLYVACTRARDWLVIPQPPRDARVGGFWRDLLAALPSSPDADVTIVDADALPVAAAEDARADLRLVAASEGGDAVAARWDAERSALVAAAAERQPAPVSAVRAAARQAPPPVAASGPGGRDFGSLVHRLLEWAPLDAAEPAGLGAMAAALAPSFGLDADAASRAAAAAARALALPVMERARKASRVWRELPLCFPDGADLVEGVVDLVFEEDGELVVVDYKTDHIAPDQALAQAAHHAGQLQLYGRGLAQATGMTVRQRLVLFTALGEAVPV